MADFNTSMNVLPFTAVSKLEYKGISKIYFPKWGGWALLDNSSTVPIDTAMLDDLVYHFYNSYFWLKLGGNEIGNQNIMNLLFVFAVHSGKRKAIEKLQRSLNVPVSGIMSTELINAVNLAHPKLLFLAFYAEIIEFLVITNDQQFINKLLGIYYKFLNSTHGVNTPIRKLIDTVLL